MDLFSHRAEKERTGQPLAERMRPRRLEEVVGQPQILGEGKLLRRLIAEADRSVAGPGNGTGASGKPGGGAPYMPSLILWGPPGTGKTTLGQLLAQRFKARLAVLSATQSGVKELRQEIETAREHLLLRGQRTVLFIDEIHRFNKGQQDALLPHVESGTVTLLGATTENPSFEINAALLSRCRVVRLEALDRDALRTLIARALTDPDRGLGALHVELPDDVREQLLDQTNGDARRTLTSLEAAALIAEPGEGGTRLVDTAVLEQALQSKVLLYDKAGDEHYNVVSAFIKSLRGSDPDAAVYWMARMLEAGEDPLFVLRRMVIFAGEDIGVADPRALPMAAATLEAVRFVGMPEAVLPMTALAIFLSTAPKSNSALNAYAAAKAAVTQHGTLPVPVHLRDGHTASARELGHGRGYKYPHDFPGHHVPQQYLPDKLARPLPPPPAGTEDEASPFGPFYEPSDSGYERTLAERLFALRRTAGTPR